MIMQAIIVRDKDLDSERQCHAIHASREDVVVERRRGFLKPERGVLGGKNGNWPCI